ncbi:dienelactone hydrolase family protein [Aestuariibacter sp. AA17]|uniref:Dienelactone hydrolase family protein n=1 Tax=Fluctibacter corallii TaxID=2984329 RepID=A0ABT3ABL1_9ALTE|nr:dienelactone hydrolase family protein [Aestuariibacter sp. AA17]MCV2886014.1 dienelactone hydrolase family protein [Aestuariibacter sp. AA17]
MRLTLVLFLLMSFNAAAFGLKIERKQLPYTNLVTMPVQSGEQTLTLAGELRVPRGYEEQKIPAVLVLHNSAGIDSTGRLYIEALNKVGIATLEIDMWGARGLSGGSGDRPETVHETLADTFAALKFLSNRSEIDPDKIGVMGFSWGGALTMLSATEQYASMFGGEYRFAAHIAHYPVCWAYSVIPEFAFENLTGAPVLIQAGQLDGYDAPDSCQNLVDGLQPSDKQYVDVKYYWGAQHAWDRLEPKWVVVDPFANQGAGGEVTLAPNRWAAWKSRNKVVYFFKDKFEM